MVLETSWETRIGWVIVRDALCIGPWHHDNERSHSHRRSPTDYDAEHVLLRLIECVQGSVGDQARVRAGVRLRRARRRLGVHRAGLRRGGRALGGHATSSCGSSPTCGSDSRAPRARARTTLQEGDVAFVALGWSEHAAADDATRRPTSGWRGPSATGRSGSSTARSPTTRGARYLQRSALTLKGLTYAPVGRADRGGHHLAARDARAETATGTTATAGSATRRSRCGRCTPSASTGRPTTSSTSSPTWPRPRRAQLQIMYGIGGEAKLEEQVLEHLSGYESARPVRIGNGAYDQHQHDVWGAVLDSIYLHTRSRDQLPDRLWPILKRQVERGARALARARPRHLGGARRAPSTSRPRS